MRNRNETNGFFGAIRKRLEKKNKRVNHIKKILNLTSNQ